MSNPVLAARSALGNATRRGDAEAVTTARRDLAAAKLETFVRETVAAAPELTPEQAARIASKLRPVAGGAS